MVQRGYSISNLLEIIIIYYKINKRIKFYINNIDDGKLNPNKDI